MNALLENGVFVPNKPAEHAANGQELSLHLQQPLPVLEINISAD
jgi:hypothetical protein